MIWFILLGSILLGIMVIRFSYKLEKNRHAKDRKDAAAAMKEFTDMLNEQKKKK